MMFVRVVLIIKRNPPIKLYQLLQTENIVTKIIQALHNCYNLVGKPLSHEYLTFIKINFWSSCKVGDFFMGAIVCVCKYVSDSHTM